MGDFFRFGRTARRPTLSPASDGRHQGLPGNARRGRKSRRLIPFDPFRYAGFVALAALAGAGLLQYGYVPASLDGGARVTNRHREGRRIVQMPTPQNATAIDGDSLRVGNQEIRLSGIDAPELFQICRDQHGREWACGREAHVRLLALLSGGMVDCASSAKDRYGRTLATCSAGPVADIGEAMVRAGLAVNFMNGRYQAAEAEARTEKRGIWRGSFERPQDYRRRSAGRADRS